MKNFTKFLAILVLGLTFSASVIGQSVSNTATATATIISPLAIGAGGTLAFGNISAGSGGGTCIVSNAGAKSFTGTCSGPTTDATRASFTISGAPNASISISIPTITLSDGGTNTMSIASWNNSLGATATLSGAGSATLDLGGVLTVAAAQATGSYTGTITVTVQYN